MADRMEFQSTIWELVDRAKSDKAASIEYVDRAYRAPIVAFLRRQGFDAHTADDLAQEVFVQLCTSSVLERARREKGKFRTLMLAITRNVARMHHRTTSALKRTPVEWEAIAPDMTPDDSFDRAWAQGLLDRAMAILESECAASGSPAHKALHAFVYRGLPYKEIARELGETTTSVGNHIHHARERLRLFLRRLVETYAEGDSQTSDEIALLERLLR